MASFDELSASFGGARSIPNDLLYGWLDASRGDLINVAKMGVDKIPGSAMGKEVRRRCKQDLLFLAGYFLWETNPFSEGWKPIAESRITETSHGVMCREFFVQKDDARPVLEQSPVKKRMVLWPRGGCKSTVDIADAVQWILNFPTIRIWFLTAADDLATGLLDELKGHWIIKAEAPTLMNLFFPEFCVEEKHLGNQFEFTCPVWAAKQIKRKEPTVFASSVTATASGWHFEVIKSDDAVSDRNSENEDQNRKVTKQFNLRKKTLVPRGYVDLVGTRYHDADLYGSELEINGVGNLVEKKGVGWTLTENTDTKSLVLIGKALEIRPEVALQLEKDGKPISYKEAGEAGCTLLLPEYMPYSYLMQLFTENEASFEGQMNQNPRPASDITFDRPLLLKNTLPFSELPFRGPISHVWDFAFSSKKGRDYTTGSSVMWKADGQMVVHDLIRQRFNPTELAQAIVKFTKDWRPFIVAVEGAAGSKLLEPAIMMEARKSGDKHVIETLSRIDWFPPDNQKDAKRVRMSTLHPALVHDKLKFASYLPHLNTLYDEFERCLKDHHHDDIPDVISHHQRYVPQMTMAAAEGEAAPEKQSSIDANYNLLYGPWITDDESRADGFGDFGGPPPVSLWNDLTPDEDGAGGCETPDGMPNILGGIFG